MPCVCVHVRVCAYSTKILSQNDTSSDGNTDVICQVYYLVHDHELLNCEND